MKGLNFLGQQVLFSLLVKTFFIVIVFLCILILSVESSKPNLVNFIKIPLHKSSESSSINLIKISLLKTWNSFDKSSKTCSVDFIKISLFRKSFNESSETSPVYFIKISFLLTEGKTTKKKRKKYLSTNFTNFTSLSQIPFF